MQVYKSLAEDLVEPTADSQGGVPAEKAAWDRVHEQNCRRFCGTFLGTANEALDSSWFSSRGSSPEFLYTN